jgi:hypothetical protein
MERWMIHLRSGTSRRVRRSNVLKLGRVRPVRSLPALLLKVAVVVELGERVEFHRHEAEERDEGNEPSAAAMDQHGRILEMSIKKFGG